jgi:Xaa-Pro aminopeptidase
MHRSLVCGIVFVSAIFAADNGVWKTAPPPPASWQRDRVADLTHRRNAAMEAIGEKGILILFAAEPRNYANDVDWPFRQENDFFYLTGLTQPGGTLVLLPGAPKREILFLPAPNPQRESWTGHMFTPDEARTISGIQEVWDAAKFNAFLTTLIPRARAAFQPAGGGRGGRGGGRGRGGEGAEANPMEAEFRPVIAAVNNSEASLYMLLPARSNPAEYGREQEFAAKLGSTGPGIAIKDATPIFSKLRALKSPRELDILKHAVDITAEGFQRAYTMAVPGAWEYEIQAQFEFTFLRRNAHWGYPCIVASGANATTLHYETNKDQMRDGDLILMDDAAEFDGYSVDVTRTIPVNGKFTKEQADIYRIVYDAQQAGFSMAKPGHAMSRGADSVNGAAIKVFKQGLYKLGLMTDPNSDEQLRVWYFHGIGHGIGLNVHDPGLPELQPGEVVTVEPGIYIRPDALDNLPKTPENEKFIAAVRPVFEKYKGIGVRIEDDVLITNGEPQVLSRGIPSKLEDVEATVAQLRKAVKTTPLP